MIAGVYVRVSTREQAEHGYSLADQEERCIQRARELDAADVIVFRDPGESGGNLARPGLTQLRDALRSKAINLVVVLDPDRLARNLSHQLLVTDEIEAAGARLEFLNFEWRNTPEGRLFYSMRGAFAEYEREKIRERSKRGIEAKARQGKLLAGGWYGYVRNQETGQFEPDPRTAPTVRKIFELIAEDRLSVNMSAKWMAEHGIPGPKGGAWHPQSLWRIVRNPVYYGVTYNFRGKWKSARHYRELEDNPDAIRVDVAPIVSRELWEEAQRSLDVVRPRARQRNAQPTSTALLAGMMRCGQCGRRMSAITTTHRGKKYRYYRCENGFAGRRYGKVEEPRCRPYEIAAHKVESAVWRTILEVLNNPERIAQAMRKDTPATNAERERLAQRVKFWEDKRARTLEAYTSGWMTKDEADETLKRCLSELTEAQMELQEIQSLAVREDEIAAKVRNVRRVAREMLHALDAADNEQRRRLAQMLIERVVFEGDQILVVGRFDEEAMPGTFVLVEAIGG